MKKKENESKLKKYDLTIKERNEHSALNLDFNSEKFREAEGIKKIGCFSLMHSSNCC